jgi:hypothetical protein
MAVGQRLDELSEASHCGRGNKTRSPESGPRWLYAALQAGKWRHPLRMVRVRTDMDPGDVEQLP